MQNLPIPIITKEVPKDGVFIGDCPNEILRTIFLNVPYGTSLVQIAMVHERFKAEALPILYKSIRLRANRTSDNHYFSKRRHELPAGLVSDPRGQPLRSFPSFCNHVQKLSLKVMNTNWYTNPKGHKKLLEMVPRIKELTLDPPPRKYDFPMSNQLTTMRLSLPHNFTHFWDPQLWPAYLDLKEYLFRPSLRNLQFDSEHDRFYYKTIHTGNIRSSTIVDLRFINWLPEDVHVLSTVLPSIKRLRNFVIEVGGLWTGSLPSLGFQPMQILAPHDYGRLLQLHNESLEQIVIAYGHRAYLDSYGLNPPPPPPPPRVSPAMGSLSSYTRLKRLAVPEHFLVTDKDFWIHPLLPPNLEELQIQVTGARDWERDHVADELKYYRFRIEAIAENKNKFVPRLKRVVLWIQTIPGSLFLVDTYVYTLNDIRDSKHNFSLDFKLHMVDIAEMFHKVNVRFEVVLTRDFKRTPFAEYLYL